MPNAFDDGQPVRPILWPTASPLFIPNHQDEVFPAKYLILQDSSTFLWKIGVTDAGILTATKGSTAAAIPAVYLNDYRSDTTTWQLGITTAGAITATSVTFDGSQPIADTLVSLGGFTWYLTTTAAGILQTNTSQNWVQLKGAGLVDKLIAIRASTDIEPAPGASTTNNIAAAYWNADSFQNDQLSQIALSAVGFTGGQTAQIGVAVRMNDNSDLYGAVIDFTGSTTTFYLFKFAAGVSTTLGSQVITGVSIGDTVAIAAQATTITAFYNGTSILSVTDSSITSGQPGVYANYTTTGDSPARGDDWNAGQFSGTSGELISYQDATLTSAYNYQIGTRIRRGVAGSTIGQHDTGSAFLRLDEEVAEWDYDPKIIGQLVFFKFTSFNLRGMQEENISNVTAYPFEITGNSLGLLSPAHATYRPTSNPLTATDAGSTTTINVASFDLRIPGINDISYSSGSIAGLAYNTLEFIYFDDPGFQGGAVVYESTTTKEIALDKAGRVFVGSIYTPLQGWPNTIGLGDGGSGAQSGMISSIGFTVVTPTVSGGGGASILDSTGSIGGVDQSAIVITVPHGDGTFGNAANLELQVPTALRLRFSTAMLYVMRRVTNTISDGGAFGYSLHAVQNTPTGTIDHVIESISTYGTGEVLGTASLDLGATFGNSFDLSNITVEIGTTTALDSTVGSLLVEVFRVWIELWE